MKNVSLTILLIANFVSTTQAEPDTEKYRLNKIDEFTGEKVSLTKGALLTSTTDKDISMEVSFANMTNNSINKQSTKFVSVKLSAINESLYVSKGNPLFLELLNGQKITLTASNDFFTRMESGGAKKTYTHVEVAYQVSANELNRINTIGISTIKMYTNKSNFETKLQASDNQKVSEVLEYVLNQ